MKQYCISTLVKQPHDRALRVRVDGRTRSAAWPDSVWLALQALSPVVD